MGFVVSEGEFLSFHLEKVVVFDERLYHGNGLINTWMIKITNRFEREAQRYAPVRTGELRSGIFSSVEHDAPRIMSGYIESSAPHSMFILAGTLPGPITRNRFHGIPPARSDAFKWTPLYKRRDGSWTWDYIPGAKSRLVERPQAGFFMKLQPGYGGNPILYRTAVRGQRANNFLLKAWRATGWDHTSIRGIGAPSTIRF